MKRVQIGVVISALSALTLAGCGSSGNPSAVTPVETQATKASSKVYLFGNMSSNSRIATVDTSMNVPDGIMVNYSSPPGATSGVFPLRSGVAVPSGPVQLAPADISGTFDVSSRKLYLRLMNNPGNSVLLKSSSNGNGEEVATLNFTLASPGIKPVMPAMDELITVGQDRGNSINYLGGCKVNFITDYL